MKKHDLERRGKLEEAVDILNSAPVTDEGVLSTRLFYGRPIRKPGLTMLLADNMKESAAAKWKVEDREWRKHNRNDSMSRLRRKPLVLHAGDKVRMQSVWSGLWDRLGEITKVRESGRSAYVKDLTSGRSFLRNRIFLKANGVDMDSACEVDEQDEDAYMAVVVQHTAGLVKSALRDSAGGRQRETAGGAASLQSTV